MARQRMASHKCLVLRLECHRQADDVPNSRVRCPSLRKRRQRNGVGSTGSEKMGGGVAYFKTIRLCSITAALSNTIAVVARDFAPRGGCDFRGTGPSKWAPRARARRLGANSPAPGAERER